MTKTWCDLYKEEIREKNGVINYINDKLKNRKVFIKLIKKYAKNNKPIIETGSGTAVVSIYLSSINYDVLAIDNNEEILNLSKKIASVYNKNIKLKFKKDSIFKLKYKKNEFSVAFSNGVLEHFNDEEIITSLKKQMYIAEYVIFGIPTSYFNKNEAMFGDERYLSNQHWRNLIKEAGGKIIEEKSFHYMRKLKQLINFKKYFKPLPFHVFVIKNN